MEHDAPLAGANFAQDAMEVSRALLDCDFEEGRIRTRLVICNASEAGFTTVASTARCVPRLRGPTGALPVLGIELAVSRLSDVIETS